MLRPPFDFLGEMRKIKWSKAANGNGASRPLLAKMARSQKGIALFS
jgi:hypothetical protein